jgi:predicted HAD superfamily hydrolase
MQKILHTFDVFDTVLTRIWANPTDLFWELGQTLREQNLILVSSETWQKIRIEAEAKARRISRTGEVRLRDIYSQLAPVVGWTELHIKQAMQLEIALENFSLRAIPATQEHIQKLRCHGNSITFISDMYLSADTIQDFLVHHQLWEPGDEIYVSGDIGVSKSSGQLFSHFLNEKDIQPNQLIHTGDNAHADIKMAQVLGIQTHEFKTSHLNRYEQAILTNEGIPLKFRSLLAGTSRLCRLSNPETNPSRQTIWDTAANVISPMLFGYVHWCIQEARKRGIERLYFVARDGQILHKIAQVICLKWGYNIDCRYFYGSRLAFHFPAIEQLGQCELDWIFDGENNIGIRPFFAKVHCNPDEFSIILAEYGFSEAIWSDTLTNEQQQELKQAFQDPRIADKIIAKAESYRQKAISYFQQEGMGDGTKFALVDIGWRGTSQTSLSKLLSIAKIYPEEGVTGFYLGVKNPVTPFQKDVNLGYFFHPNSPLERSSLLYKEMLELFTYADHPSTTAYEWIDNIYQPVFREQLNKSALDWGITVQQQAIVIFAEYLTDVIASHECASDYFHEIIEKLLNIFMFSPTRAEAEAYGSFQFSSNITEDFFFEFAQVYDRKDLMHLFQYLRGGVYPAWLPALVKRSTPTVRPLLQIAMASSSGRRFLGFAQESNKRYQAREATSFLWKAIKAYPVIITKKCFIKTSSDIFYMYVIKKKRDM